MQAKQAHQIWLQAAEKVKDQIVAPTLYRALELGVGITVDGEYFVLGFSSADMPMASHLRSSQNMATIEKCISEVLKTKVRLRIIEGTTEQDYEHYKQQMAAREASAGTVSERREQERAVQVAWEEVGEKISRAYARLHLRQFPQSKVQIIKYGFEVINEAVKRFNYDENSDEIQKRSLARVFEKFATAVEIPSALLAYEFFKLREEGKLP